MAKKLDPLLLRAHLAAAIGKAAPDVVTKAMAKLSLGSTGEPAASANALADALGSLLRCSVLSSVTSRPRSRHTHSSRQLSPGPGKYNLHQHCCISLLMLLFKRPQTCIVWLQVELL